MHEKQEKIIEFHENIGINLNGNNSLNEGENVTFIKKNTTQKESILSIEATKKILEKNSLFTNNNLNTLNETESNKNKKISKVICNSEAQKNENFIKQSSLYPYGCQTYKSKENKDNSNSNSNISSHLRIKLYQNSYSKNEKLLYNIFTTLSITQEKSFQLNSSYDNINAISNNKYIKDINLQSKIKEILIKECTNISPIKKKGTFLKIPDIFNNVSRTPKSSKKLNFKNFKNIFSDLKFVKIENNQLERTINDESIKKKINPYKSSQKSGKDSYIIESFNESTKKKQFRSTQKIVEIKKRDKLSSSRINIYDCNKLKTPILDNRKLKQKIINKKPIKINRQLNLISKNIQNTSKNIKNPEEFYMNLFNDIIAKESKRSYNLEGEDNENNILKLYSGKEIKGNYNRKSSNAVKSLNDSITSNKDSIKESNLNLNVHKKK